MKISLDSGSSVPLISAYSDHQIVINDQVYRTGLLIGPAGLTPDWGPESIADLSEQALAPALSQNPEILILGSGRQHCFPTPALMAAIMAKNIGLEVMNTATACGTYNVLAAEDRRVVAALILN